jgi:hypothetical protein
MVMVLVEEMRLEAVIRLEVLAAVLVIWPMLSRNIGRVK